jgi:hypothetical protein
VRLVGYLKINFYCIRLHFHALYALLFLHNFSELNRRFTLKIASDVRDSFTSPINHEHRDYGTQNTGPPNLLNFPELAAQYTNTCTLVLVYAQPCYNLSECLGFFIILNQTIRRHISSDGNIRIMIRLRIMIKT